MNRSQFQALSVAAIPLFAAPAWGPTATFGSQNRVVFEPVQCGVDNKVVLRQVQITAGARPAVLARERCEVTIEDSVIHSDTIAVDARERATIKIIKSEIRGGDAAIRQDGRSQVSARGSVIQGRRLKENLAEFRDEGGNSFRP